MDTGNTTDQGKAEMFRLLCFGQDFDTFYGTANTSPGWALLMWFTTIVGVDFEKKAGGNPFQNGDLKDYTFDNISPDDMEYLHSLLGDEVDTLLDKMNDTEIFAERSARNWLEHYDTPTGKLKNPVIQLHSVFDPLNFAAGTAIYKETVENAGKEDLLLQVYTGEAFPGYPTGHGFFNPIQYLQVLAAMNAWLDTGEKPDPLDPAGYFAPGYGFIPGFVPPPWPF